jgi:hypothetical protein
LAAETAATELKNGNLPEEPERNSPQFLPLETGCFPSVAQRGGVAGTICTQNTNLKRVFCVQFKAALVAAEGPLTLAQVHILMRFTSLLQQTQK